MHGCGADGVRVWVSPPHADRPVLAVADATTDAAHLAYRTYRYHADEPSRDAAAAAAGGAAAGAAAAAGGGGGAAAAAAAAGGGGGARCCPWLAAPDRGDTHLTLLAAAGATLPHAAWRRRNGGGGVGAAAPSARVAGAGQLSTATTSSITSCSITRRGVCFAAATRTQ
eukprot:COSAG05_NODE_485_length_9349_cov_60.192865_1_plen_169_part_00